MHPLLMKEKLGHLLLCICFLTLGSCGDHPTNSTKERTEHQTSAKLSPPVLHYFIDHSIARVKEMVPKYEELHMNGGIDGFLLLRIYPLLRPNDLERLTTGHGEYSVQRGELVFTGHQTSTSAVLDTNNFKTLLLRCSQRLGLSIKTTAEVQQLIDHLENGKKGVVQ